MDIQSIHKRAKEEEADGRTDGYKSDIKVTHSCLGAFRNPP